MNFDIVKEEFDSLNNLISLNKIKVSDDRFNDMQLRKEVIEGIQISFISDCTSAETNEGVSEKVDKIMNSKTLSPQEMRLRKFSEAYAISVLLAYLQSFNSDRKVNDEDKPKFGYKDLDKAIRLSFFGTFSDIDSGSVTSLLSAGLLCDVRDIASKEYFDKGLYKDDLKLLNDTLAVDINDGYNTKMLNAIKENDDLATKIDSYMSNLEAFYTYLLEDSFGIEPFKGVYKDSSSFLTISSSNNAVRINEGVSTLQKLATRISSSLGDKIVISDSRQFDYDAIFKSDKVVYHPYKILEYVLGRESTLNISSNIYKPSAYAQSWESYSTNYVFKNLRDILIRGIYVALEKILLEDRKISGGFASSSTMIKIGTDYDNYLVDISIDAKRYFDKLDTYISKLVESMSCFYILSSYGYLAKRITIINIRVTVGTNFNCFNNDALTTTKLFKDLIAANDNEVFTPPFCLTEGRKTSTNISLAFDILEFQYNVNPMLASAEPLFGYVIQRANQKKGVASNWKNILIGKSYSGKEIYASDTSDIKLQNNFIHNIYAGSRAGKGVMTMNVLVSAVATGKPIFYLDRKPDMASMLYQYSNGKQFIVNGGLINAKDDVFKKFDEDTGVALDYWRAISKPYLETHPKILELFGVSNVSYQGILGDYIYFRAVMFCLGLCVIRSAAIGKNETVFNNMNGKNGIVIVIDELTGFQNNIAQLLADISSTFVSKALNLDEVDEILQIKDELNGKIRVAQAKMDEATKDSVRMKAEEEIRLLNKKISNLVDTQSLYAGTFFNKIRSSYNTLLSQKVAGFKQGEFKFSDIFVLGQILDANYYSTSLTSSNKGTISSVFFPLKSDKKDYYAGYKNADIVRSFLEELGEADWFLGRNEGYNYANKYNTPMAKTVCDDDGNWDYVGKHTTNEIRGVDDANFSHVYFKPYLVLNTNDEADPPISGYGSSPIISESGIKSYTYVGQCVDRTNKSAGGIDLWDSVRVKHLTEEAKKTYSSERKNYDCLDDGIGFKGLVRDTLLTTSEGKKAASGDINEYVIDCLSKSGDIANFVAIKMGYKCWQELIFDFSPKGIFSFEDMRNAVLEPSKYTLESRLPLHTALGVPMDSDSSSNSVLPSEPSFYENFDGGYNEQPDLSEQSNNTHESNFSQESQESQEGQGSALDDLRRQNQQSREQQDDKLDDDSLMNIVVSIVSILPNFSDLTDDEQVIVIDDVFNYFRRAGV